MRLGSKGGKSRGKGQKGKTDRARVAYEEDRWWDDSWDEGRYISDTEWIAAVDDWTAEDCYYDPEYYWMAEEYQEEDGTWVLGFSEAGMRALEDYVWTYDDMQDGHSDGAWIEPVAYARDSGSSAADPSEKVEELETEGTRKAREEAFASRTDPPPLRRSPIILGGLGEAMKWKPGEAGRKAVDVEVGQTDGEESVRRVGEQGKAERVLGRGWNLEVQIRIGTLNCHVLFDSGASRNIIRTAFRKQLQGDSETKSFVLGPYRGDRKISIAGIHANEVRSTANDISQIVDVTFQFVFKNQKVGPLVTVQFGEMDSSVDDLIVGNPQMFEWGFSGCLDQGTQVPRFNLLKPKVDLDIVKWYPNPQLRGTLAGAGGRTGTEGQNTARWKDESTRRA